MLLLPQQTKRNSARFDQVQAAWSAGLGGGPVLLMRNAQRARSLLLKAAGVSAGEPIAIPAQASHSLVEVVKQSEAQPLFLGLGADLAPLLDPAQRAGVRLLWLQPGCGLSLPLVWPNLTCWLDHADTLPNLSQRVKPGQRPAVCLYGLHLSADPQEAGALLTFAGPEGLALYEALATRIGPADRPDPVLALAQYQRLVGHEGEPGLVERQQTALAAVRCGLEEAAGLPLLPVGPELGLAYGVAVGVPPEGDVSTFYAYVRGENTPISWLPELRPLHYAALQGKGLKIAQSAAAHLSRWLLAPVGPDYTSEEISHAVLGVVKTAEYLGLRWYTQPGRAVSYATLLDEWYGPGHDAYRPSFDIWEAASRQPLKVAGPTMVCELSPSG